MNMKTFFTKCAAMIMLLLALWGTEVVYAQEEYSDEQESYNLLLIGSDHRDDSWNGNSDVVILVTVNQDSEEIILTSFMRDLYADMRAAT